MSNKHSLEWQIAFAALVLHILCFLAMWGIAIIRAADIPWMANIATYRASEFQTQLFVVLVWVPVLMIHIGVHFYLAGRTTAEKSEREAYRDGLQDGIRYSADDGYEPHRLMLDEDGELVEFEGKRKNQ